MEQIEEAVRCALDPGSAPDIKSQATQYCEQVKGSSDGWRVCLDLFTAAPERGPEVRLFALQAIEAMIADAGIRGDVGDAPAKLEIVRKILLEFVSTQYSGDRYRTEPGFIKNTLAHTITMLALASYPTQWPTFLQDMVTLTGILDGKGSSDEQSARSVTINDINPALVDFFNRVLGSLDDELVSRIVPRSAEETARNTEIKDAMRVADVNIIAHAWYAVLLHLSDSRPDLTEGVLRLMGAYVSWIDINLVVNQSFMRILFGLLRIPALRCAACRCLVDIVGKGMRSMEKLSLLQFLGIVDAMKQLEISDTEFANEVGKLANVTGIELKAVWMDKGAITSDAAAAAETMLEQLLPLLLSFLSHKSPEVISSVFPVVNDLLAVYKKMQRDSVALNANQQEFLTKLLPVLVDKLQYSDDYTWPSPTDAAFGDNDGSLDEDDDEAMFNELRHNLRVFIDAIGQIAPELYNSVILATAKGIFEQCNQHGVSFDQGNKGHGQLGWIRAELGIYLTQAYGELLSSSRGLRFGAPKHGQSGTGNQVNDAISGGPSVESLKNLLSMMIQSNVVSSTHPSIAPIYFENVVRFGGYFEVQREAVAPVLTAFLGNTGVHHPYNTVRPRIWYFLHRFVKQLPGSVLAPFSSDFISAVAGMLKVNADAAVLGGTSGVASSYGLFDSQLFLFEACGMMLAPMELDDSTRMALLQHLLGPLFSGAQRLMNSKSAEQILQDTQGLLQIHHYLTAIGSVVKGFPDVRVDSKTTSASAPQQLSPSTVQVFLKAADMCVTILGALRANQLIREASRFTLSRMLGVLGAEALPYLSQLANSLVSSCAVEELVDLLGLLGQVVFKFKPRVAPTASELLLPVISKVYGFLDQVAQNGATGTDEAVLLQELQKAYLSWIVAIFNSDLDCIFLAPQNVRHLITIFRPIAAQLATDSSNPQCQRLAFSALTKAIQAWLVDPQGWHTLATLSSATVAAINNKAASLNESRRPLLRQAATAALGLSPDSESSKDAYSQFRDFVMSTVLSACFETPTRSGFSLADAQMLLVVSEISSLLQMMLLAGMPEIVFGTDQSITMQMRAPQLPFPPIGGDLNENPCVFYMSKVLRDLGCSEHVAFDFVQALASLDQKQFKKYFVAFLSRSSSELSLE
ncbi:Xpo1-domain-containing protein [Coemansia reversa NRRL 1564]|uniref:Exportin-T n=1 Tax=Coemansia reversa (strain ATCC 12441 / NRRL 1564) TaxID=763665 RepID=A0A2G5BAX6_COERN|nr:Xpo1-domain-containing protein [Coemansia reversa NRRL 1564]|eukprot:PIA15867.1 Xpo1-domain-containing protein [Coemansia reversa NRRL 1564]